MTDRLIDPHRQPDATLERRLGVATGGQLRRKIDRAVRYTPGTTPVLRTRTLTWYRANIGASGDAAYLMRLAAPSSDSAWAMVNLPWLAPAAGRITGIDLWASEARTGGTATARVRITTNGVAEDVTFPSCQLNATTTRMATMDRLWVAGHPFAKGATLEGRVLTASTFGPTTADVTMVLHLAFLDEV